MASLRALYGGNFTTNEEHMKDYAEMTFEELSNHLMNEAKDLHANVKDALYPNKSAMARARKILLELEKSGKTYRKLTVRLANQPKAKA